MRLFLAILIFYKRLLLPALAFAIVVGLLPSPGPQSIKTAGIALIPFSLLFHYYIYELRNPQEYYFYYNLGLSRLLLWSSTLVISSLICFTLIILL